jgi:hypothetical protein
LIATPLLGDTATECPFGTKQCPTATNEQPLILLAAERARPGIRAASTA